MNFDKNIDINQLSAKELAQYVIGLQAENDRLREEKANAGTISCKVSEKGAVSVYGMGRFPITLYREQWERLIANIEKIKGFIKAHASELSTKESKSTVKTPANVPELGDVPFGQVV